jgi:hypothetical protein
VSLTLHAIAALNCVGRPSFPPKQRRQRVGRYNVTRHVHCGARELATKPPHQLCPNPHNVYTTQDFKKSHPPTLGVSGKSSHTDPGWTLQRHCRQSFLSIPAPPSSSPSADRAARWLTCLLTERFVPTSQSHIIPEAATVLLGRER